MSQWVWINVRRISPAVSIVALIAIMVSGLAFAGSVHFGIAQSSTPVNGIISSDATWTKANSPYSLTGPVGVASGVTLTIEAGVTVDLASYYIQVNGTLIAQGTGTDPINFNNGASIEHAAITLNSGSDSIIENAVFSTGATISINSASPKIINNSVYSISVWGGSPIITNNTITYAQGSGIYVHGGSPSILNNTVDGIISVQGARQ